MPITITSVLIKVYALLTLYVLKCDPDSCTNADRSICVMNKGYFSHRDRLQCAEYGFHVLSQMAHALACRLLLWRSIMDLSHLARALVDWSTVQSDFNDHMNTQPIFFS